MRRQERFAPHGALALNPKAFGAVFDLNSPAGNAIDGDVAVVTIRGPLMHHKEFFFDSYESIEERVSAALAENPRLVVLSIDSPGGLVSGAFETARKLKKLAADADVDLYAHINGQGTSAAYALATAASWIGAHESAEVGSIGVINTMVDVVRMNESQGINIELVASGKRKSDSNPNSPITDGARESMQARVNELAEMFFELVSETRGLSVDFIRSLEAGLMHGKEAVSVGLIDGVTTLEQTIAFATSEPASGETEAATKGRYGMALEATVAELRKVAEGDDEEEAKQARKMLSALEDDKEESKSEDDKEESKSEDDKEESKSEDDKEESKSEDDDDEKSATAMAAEALAKVHRMELRQKKREEDTERAKLLASRPDFSKEMIEVLEKAPMATVRSMVKKLEKGEPKPKNPKAAAAQASVRPTQGKDQASDNSPRLPPEEKMALDAAFGLNKSKAGVINTPYKVVLGGAIPVTTPES